MCNFHLPFSSLLGAPGSNTILWASQLTLFAYSKWLELTKLYQKYKIYQLLGKRVLFSPCNIAYLENVL